ncbi:MAG: hypothetical protein EBZ50_13890 [Alphaproteobacteria bacterium]|nr:hypothetical protein [Alphaproteobacteria bacterium]
MSEVDTLPTMLELRWKDRDEAAGWIIKRPDGYWECTMRWDYSEDGHGIWTEVVAVETSMSAAMRVIEGNTNPLFRGGWRDVAI